MHYRVQLLDTLTPAERAIVEAYWKIENGDFVHLVKNIAEEHGLSIYEVSSLGSQGATFEVFWNNCIGCGDAVIQPIRSRNELQKGLLNFEPRRCAICQPLWLKRQAFERRQIEEQVGNPLGPNAIPLRPWEQLPEAELRILQLIVQGKSKAGIYALLFPDRNYRNQQTWDLVNRLEARRLVKVEREYDKSITAIHYQPELEDIWAPSQAQPNIPPEQELRVVLTATPESNVSGLPVFAGAFTVSKPVQLRPDQRYNVAAWKGNKDRVILQIAPLSVLPPLVPMAFELAGPQQLGVILERMRDSQEEH